MDGQRERFSVTTLCRVLGVSPSGYYAWRSRGECRRAREDRRLLVHVRSAFAQSRQTYGSPRVYQELRGRSVRCGRNRVARLMREHGIRPALRKRFKATTDSRHSLPIAQNLLGRQFGAQAPNRRWSADITYLWTREGWLYLAVVMDLFSRRIVGWCMQASLHKELVLGTLAMARGRRHPRAGLLHHSDRGSQYASTDYQTLLEEAGIACSMSRKGNCWDNAPVESFLGTLEQELVNRCRFATRQQARQAVFEYIEVWYNRQRRHSSLGYVSPAEFERQALGEAGTLSSACA